MTYTTLVISKLAQGYSQQELQNSFEQFGAIDHISLMTKPDGTPADFAYITFQDVYSTNNALTAVCPFVHDHQPEKRLARKNDQVKTTAFIKDVAPGTSKEDIMTHFKRYNIQDVSIFKGNDSWHAYCKFETEYWRDLAIIELRHSWINGMRISCDYSLVDFPGK